MSASLESIRNTIGHELINRTIDGKLSFEDYILAIEHDVHACFDDANKVKAHLNTRDKQGRTLLHHAVMQNNSSLTTTLVYYGFDINQLDAKGNTPLDYAFIDKDPKQKIIKSAELESIETIRCTLLQLGANAKTKIEALKAWIEINKNVKKSELAETPAAELVKLKNTLTEKKHFDELRAQILLKDKIVPCQKWLNLKSTYDLFYRIFSIEALILEEFEARSAEGNLGDAKASAEKITISEILAMIEKEMEKRSAADADKFLTESSARIENLKREMMEQEQTFRRELQALQNKEQNEFLKHLGAALQSNHKALMSSLNLDSEAGRLTAKLWMSSFTDLADELKSGIGPGSRNAKP